MKGAAVARRPLPNPPNVPAAVAAIHPTEQNNIIQRYSSRAVPLFSLVNIVPKGSIIEKNKPKGKYTTMYIAVTYDNGIIFQHFDHTEFFKVYDVQEGKVVSSEVISTNG